MKEKILMFILKLVERLLNREQSQSQSKTTVVVKVNKIIITKR